MNELLKINHEGGQPTVSGRDLHSALKIKTAYKDWFPRMCEYGFTEKVDFNPLIIEQVRLEGSREVKRQVVDHQLTIPMAKELCMIQRSEIGRMFRQYFIKVEEAWNSPEAVLARALQVANNKIDSLDLTVKSLNAQIEQDKPKVLFAEAVSSSRNSILVGDLAKLIKQNGYDIGQKRLFAWMRDNGYLIKRKGSDWNMPTQRSMEQELFEIKENTYLNRDGVNVTTKTPKVTGKGQVFFVNKFVKEIPNKGGRRWNGNRQQFASH